MAHTVKNSPAVQETWVRSLGWKDPLEKRIAAHSSVFPGGFHGQRSLMGYSPWDTKSQTQLNYYHTHISCQALPLPASECWQVDRTPGSALDTVKHLNDSLFQQALHC